MKRVNVLAANLTVLFYFGGCSEIPSQQKTQEILPPPTEIELPKEYGKFEGEKITFRIPQDCKAVRAYYNKYGDQLMSTPEIGDMHGILSICDFYDLLKNGNSNPKYDFVSTYDWMNASLDDLPYELRALGYSSPEFGEFMEEIGAQGIKCSYLRFQVLYDYNMDSTVYNRIDLSNCHLSKKVDDEGNPSAEFIGQIVVNDGILQCESSDDELDVSGIGFRRIAFRDIDHDDYMDAIITFYDIGSGSASGLPSVWMLTRKSKDAKLFEVVRQSESFTGTISKTLKIQMKLKFEGSKVSGTYFYEKYKSNIRLEGTIDDQNNIVLNEFDDKDNITGIFKGRLVSSDKIEGTWSKPDSSKQLPFVVTKP